MSDRTPTETKPSPYLQQLIEELADFSGLVRLTHMWEIGWVAEDHQGRGDSTAIIRLIERVRQMLPGDFALSEEEESPRVLEEALAAAYRHSGSLAGGHVRLAVSEPTLFGQAIVETDLDAVEAPIRLMVCAADGREADSTLLCPDELYYDELLELLEDVANRLVVE